MQTRGWFPPNKNTTQIISKKYDYQFNFYLTKSINHIIYNRKSEEATLTAKDIAILIEDIEYLKRYYTQLNNQGKNEIKDRMTLLLNFYATANMLQYEYPVMIINNMQEIFKKRRKKLFQGQNSQESSSQSEESHSDKQIAIENEDQIKEDQLALLNDLDWSDIIHCNQPREKEKTAKEILDFEEQFSIYDAQQKKTDAFFNKIQNLTSQLAFEMTFDQVQNEKQVNYLILDFDDLDKERIIKQYTKLTNKQNVPLQSKNKAMKASHINSLTDKKPLSSSITIDTLKQSNFKQKRNYQTLNRQSMFIGSREQRDKEIKLMKKSSDLQFEAKKAFIFSEDMIINQNQCQESPLHEGVNDFNFFPKGNQTKPHYFLADTNKPQGQGVMKQSEIIHNDYFIKEKYQTKHPNNDFKSQLKKIKQNPFELKQILKIQDHNEKDPHKNPHDKKEHKNQLPFYLKRVKSHEELKPFVHDDKGFYKKK